MKLKMLSPDEIMGIVVVIIVFAVGAYAFFVTVGSIPTGYTATGHQSHFSNATYHSLMNLSGTGTSVFNVLGIVLLISAIMLIVAVVYSYIRPSGPTM